MKTATLTQNEADPIGEARQIYAATAKLVRCCSTKDLEEVKVLWSISRDAILRQQKRTVIPTMVAEIQKLADAAQERVNLHS